MQKKVIALAVAALVSGTALAQSNVTVYGVMDLYAGAAKADNAAGNQSQTVVNSGGLWGSRLGFMGEEALGNGLKAIFKLELGTLTPDQSTNNIGSTRQSYVGLTSDTLGTVYAGRVQTLGWVWSVNYDVMGQGNAFSTLAAFGDRAGMLLTTGSGLGRQSNAISYISPNLNGVTIRADVAAGEQVTGTSGATGINKAQGFYSIGADYNKGPLAVGVAYAALNNQGGTLNNAGSRDIKDWSIGATYDFKVVKPFASYQESKNNYATGIADLKNKMWGLGVAIPVGATGSAVKAAYTGFKNDLTNANQKANGWAIDYEHALSKRTTAYVGYHTIHNGTNVAFNTEAASVSTSNGKNTAFYGLGLLHSF